MSNISLMSGAGSTSFKSYYAINLGPEGPEAFLVFQDINAPYYGSDSAKQITNISYTVTIQKQDGGGWSPFDKTTGISEAERESYTFTPVETGLYRFLIDCTGYVDGIEKTSNTYFRYLDVMPEATATPSVDNGAYQIGFSWNNIGDETYKIQRQSDGVWTDIADDTDQSLSPNEPYVYRMVNEAVEESDEDYGPKVYHEFTACCRVLSNLQFSKTSDNDPSKMVLSWEGGVDDDTFIITAGGKEVARTKDKTATVSVAINKKVRWKVTTTEVAVTSAEAEQGNLQLENLSGRYNMKDKRIELSWVNPDSTEIRNINITRTSLDDTTGVLYVTPTDGVCAYDSNALPNQSYDYELSIQGDHVGWLVYKSKITVFAKTYSSDGFAGTTYYKRNEIDTQWMNPRNWTLDYNGGQPLWTDPFVGEEYRYVFLDDAEMEELPGAKGNKSEEGCLNIIVGENAHVSIKCSFPQLEILSLVLEDGASLTILLDTKTESYYRPLSGSSDYLRGVHLGLYKDTARVVPAKGKLSLGRNAELKILATTDDRHEEYLCLTDNLSDINIHTDKSAKIYAHVNRASEPFSCWMESFGWDAATSVADDKTTPLSISHDFLAHHLLIPRNPEIDGNYRRIWVEGDLKPSLASRFYWSSMADDLNYSTIIEDSDATEGAIIKTTDEDYVKEFEKTLNLVVAELVATYFTGMGTDDRSALTALYAAKFVDLMKTGGNWSSELVPESDLITDETAGVNVAIGVGRVLDYIADTSASTQSVMASQVGFVFFGDSDSTIEFVKDRDGVQVPFVYHLRFMKPRGKVAIQNFTGSICGWLGLDKELLAQNDGKWNASLSIDVNSHVNVYKNMTVAQLVNNGTITVGTDYSLYAYDLHLGATSVLDGSANNELGTGGLIVLSSQAEEMRLVEATDSEIDEMIDDGASIASTIKIFVAPRPKHYYLLPNKTVFSEASSWSMSGYDGTPATEIAIGGNNVFHVKGNVTLTDFQSTAALYPRYGNVGKLSMVIDGENRETVKLELTDDSATGSYFNFGFLVVNNAILDLVADSKPLVYADDVILNEGGKAQFSQLAITRRVTGKVATGVANSFAYYVETVNGVGKYQLVAPEPVDFDLNCSVESIECTYRGRGGGIWLNPNGVIVSVGNDLHILPNPETTTDTEEILDLLSVDNGEFSLGGEGNYLYIERDNVVLNGETTQSQQYVAVLGNNVTIDGLVVKAIDVGSDTDRMACSSFTFDGYCRNMTAYLKGKENSIQGHIQNLVVGTTQSIACDDLVLNVNADFLQLGYDVTATVSDYSTSTLRFSESTPLYALASELAAMTTIKELHLLGNATTKSFVRNIYVYSKGDLTVNSQFGTRNNSSIHASGNKDFVPATGALSSYACCQNLTVRSASLVNGTSVSTMCGKAHFNGPAMITGNVDCDGVIDIYYNKETCDANSAPLGNQNIYLMVLGTSYRGPNSMLYSSSGGREINDDSSHFGGKETNAQVIDSCQPDADENGKLDSPYSDWLIGSDVQTRPAYYCLPWGKKELAGSKTTADDDTVVVQDIMIPAPSPAYCNKEGVFWTHNEDWSAKQRYYIRRRKTQNLNNQWPSDTEVDRYWTSEPGQYFIVDDDIAEEAGTGKLYFAVFSDDSSSDNKSQYDGTTWVRDTDGNWYLYDVTLVPDRGEPDWEETGNPLMNAGIETQGFYGYVTANYNESAKQSDYSKEQITDADKETEDSGGTQDQETTPEEVASNDLQVSNFSAYLTDSTHLHLEWDKPEIKAANLKSNSYNVNSIKFVPQKTKPQAPSYLMISLETEEKTRTPVVVDETPVTETYDALSQIVVTWRNDSAVATGFEIEKWNGSGWDNVTEDIVSPDRYVEAFTGENNDVSKNEFEFTYRVRSVNDIGGDELKSNWVIGHSKYQDNVRCVAISTDSPVVGSEIELYCDVDKPTYYIKWQRSSDKEKWVNIPGATGGTYMPTSADEGKYLRVQIESSASGAFQSLAVEATEPVTTRANQESEQPTTIDRDLYKDLVPSERITIDGTIRQYIDIEYRGFNPNTVYYISMLTNAYTEPSEKDEVWWLETYKWRYNLWMEEPTIHIYETGLFLAHIYRTLTPRELQRMIELRCPLLTEAQVMLLMTGLEDYSVPNSDFRTTVLYALDGELIESEDVEETIEAGDYVLENLSQMDLLIYLDPVKDVESVKWSILQAAGGWNKNPTAIKNFGNITASPSDCLLERPFSDSLSLNHDQIGYNFKFIPSRQQDSLGNVYQPFSSGGNYILRVIITPKETVGAPIVLTYGVTVNNS